MLTPAGKLSPPTTQGAATPEPASTPAPARITRRQFFRKLAIYGTLPTVIGAYATQIEPFWPEFHEITIAIPNLPKSFEGFRIAQLTDLHAGRTPFGYLQRVFNRVRDEMKPDLFAVTGDITHHDADWIDAAANMLGETTIPVIVSYGNHEYGIERADDETADAELPNKMEAALLRNRCIVLRNRSTTVTRGSDRLWFVGLDDLWFGDFNTHVSFSGVPANEATIALSHNPDTADRVDRHRPSLILAGHTHGGQVRLPGIGALHLNTQNQKLDQGLFHLGNGTPLYVSRGVGYIHRIRFYCRPEVPVFRLACA